MAFIRTKLTKRGTPKHYLVESYRDDDGKVKQRVVAYLGKYATVEQALAELPIQIERFKRFANPPEPRRRKRQAMRPTYRPYRNRSARYDAQLQRLRSALDGRAEQISKGTTDQQSDSRTVAVGQSDKSGPHSVSRTVSLV